VYEQASKHRVSARRAKLRAAALPRLEQRLERLRHAARRPAAVARRSLGGEHAARRRSARQQRRLVAVQLGGHGAHEALRAHLDDVPAAAQRAQLRDCTQHVVVADALRRSAAAAAHRGAQRGQLHDAARMRARRQARLHCGGAGRTRARTAARQRSRAALAPGRAAHAPICTPSS
jgi:hypothetical protein